MAAGPVAFVCPRCKVGVAFQAARGAYVCVDCRRRYPVLCGIPDFRLEPDPYISMEDDRAKGAVLHRLGADASFEQLLRRYYDMTPEDPPDLAEGWIRHALAEVEIAARFLRDVSASDVVSGFRETVSGAAGRPASGRALLDVGCSTGGLLVAGAGAFEGLVGVDVAFRWLVVGQVRLREAGVGAALVCANAEHLPFPDGSFDAVACVDTLEHVRDPAVSVAEALRVSAPGAWFAGEWNNRWTPMPEPHLKLWGVGWLPRRLQAGYVAARRRDLHAYSIRLRGAAEVAGFVKRAGYRRVRVTPAPVPAGRLTHPLWRIPVRAYDALRRAPGVRTFLRLAAPRLRVMAERSPEDSRARPPAPAAAADVATASRAPGPERAGRADT